MSAEQDYGTGKLKLSFARTMDIVKPYVSNRFMEQLKGVWFIIFYLVAFQYIVLGLPLVYTLMISTGILIVIIGLMFFMEGLMLGLMPFGEVIGAVLPKKSKLPTILLFSFILGVAATFAEPAIAVLKAAGAGVIPEKAPLLYSLLNEFSGQLVNCVGAGVGIAVLLGVLRFLYGWSLKIFIVPLVLILSGFTIWAHTNEVLYPIIGLAWDCGAVTTGPVTVPLVLALGIGVCRVVSSGDSSGAGFGIVTLASLFPIIAVLCLGTYHYKAADYYGAPNSKIAAASVSASVAAVVEEEVPEQRFTEAEFEEFTKSGNIDGKYEIDYNSEHAVFEDGKIVLQQPTVIYKKSAKSAITGEVPAWSTKADIVTQIKKSIIAALLAIIPLCAFLFIVLKFVLREKVPRADEIGAGIVFAVVGMALFGLGIELGLTPLGEQLGGNIPAAFSNIVPWELTGHAGPLYGEFSGKLVAIVFAFFLGYGATLAEPALNALGSTVEKITVGAFKKSLLMKTVAIGVGCGIAMGVLKIAFNIPLTFLLIPPYIALIFLTLISSEQFVNFGWDSAGVTTGPITVPLVLAMGLGVGASVPGVTDGFGVLAMASVAPIIAVLTVG
ncbi:MAG: DUF1538 domain-containing protein, partial [Flavobacteriales bacterium]|nr:DUF1538 domain-containing protein [Flavobacteriales bacterium]